MSNARALAGTREDGFPLANRNFQRLWFCNLAFRQVHPQKAILKLGRDLVFSRALG